MAGWDFEKLGNLTAEKALWQLMTEVELLVDRSCGDNCQRNNRHDCLLCPLSRLKVKTKELKHEFTELVQTH